MGLPEDLHVLQDLHEKGKLTDKEFADAKAAVLKKYQEPTPAGHSSSFSIRPRTALLLAILLLLVGLIWYNAGTKRTTEMIATAVHAPIEVKNEVENLPASSWKAVALNLPYSGALNVNLEVVRGNPVDVFLTTPDQLEAMKKEQWNQVR